MDAPGVTVFDLLEELHLMVKMAEELFGPRDESYEILPPEFHALGPQVFYPEESKILIKLSFHCSHDPVRTAYQLAHESIHVLSPVNIGWASVLEEGLATCFSYRYVCERFEGQGEDQYLDSGDPWLNHAHDLVARMLSTNPTGIKEMREEEFVISDFSAELILQHYPELSDEEAELLTKHFQPWRKEEQEKFDSEADTEHQSELDGSND